MRRLLLAVAAICASTFVPKSAGAWTNAGHMAAAAIAYYDLGGANSPVVKKIVGIIASHPDPGPFKVAIGRATGDEQVLRTFMEIARWSDDVRTGGYDHPTWHYMFRPVIDPAAPPAGGAPYAETGDAREALAVNLRIARDTKDPRVSAGERAIALCWIFHIVGDIHQPLHAAEWFSSAMPEGDFAGDRFYVLDPSTRQPVKLHRYWDDLPANQEDTPYLMARSQELMRKHPRANFSSMLKEAERSNFDAWARESYSAAVNTAYDADRPKATTPESATLPTPAYLAESKLVAEERLALAGYRLADVVRELYGATQ